jgi:hypothetical protein
MVCASPRPNQLLGKRKAADGISVGSVARVYGEGASMKYIIDFLTLLGLVCTIIVVGFYVGYVTYQPKCHTVASVFTKECK